MLNTDASFNAAAPSPRSLLLWPFLTTLGLLLLAESVRAAPCWAMPLPASAAGGHGLHNDPLLAVKLAESWMDANAITACQRRAEDIVLF
ncbi:hypothetical protein [Allochromatium tepidum]|uniref:Uncharacterized protein n=1 Tax=Allochromatium tepidum TaxID=553982 RepID=A0ABM7QR27_9GAMM|nr:hypothetical protein [Allochromatium tepidum]BCU08372.1 hypothetical protein Atep_30490 [Allochromatium tepidum]